MREDAVEALESQREALLADLDASPAVDRRGEVEPLLRDSIALRTRAATDADLATGATRLGGRPDLPPDFELPSFRHFFLGQIDLSAVAPFDVHGLLPPDGLLSFFHGMDPSRGDVAMVHHLPLAGLQPHPLKRERPAVGVDFGAQVELPPFGSHFLDGGRVEETYMRFFQTRQPSTEPRHGLLGYDRPDDALLRPSQVLLLRLDAGHDVPYDFVEMSALYVLIERDALAERRFDAATIEFGYLG